MFGSLHQLMILYQIQESKQAWFQGFNPVNTETVLLVGYWSPITDTLLYT